MKEQYHILGIMSGTSLDGIDLVEVDLFVSEKGLWDFVIKTCETIAYAATWKQKLTQGITNSEAELIQLDKDYTVYLSKVILSFIKKNHITDLDAVCSHGHTILHQPEQGVTFQIGNLPELANAINEQVVCDFRVQDVALGGQGAPLVPIGDRLLFSEYDYCLNLGGFANISSEVNGKRIAYDICPVNIVLNSLVEKLGFPYDDKGNIAASGALNEALLKRLNELDFYKQSAPKSLGLEWVQDQVFPILEASELSEKDLLRTFVEHCALQIAAQFKEEASVLITGGGAYNDFLISRLKVHTTVAIVIPSEEIIEYKEALIFGLLGLLKLRNEVNCLSSVTGANKDHSSGTVYPRKS
ncbi:anhydro-N-acetylmuramic acid kinase [Cochleicola gelatinilyticus]|uniref:Anhydro-N-acetylmuramic acid kinase n=1 Tax=Cochleicola gelatinilyticus TaxID=1763537 RepID=A0A167IHS6_9FLAO|nr:anhydro-N-acetylmuramic acid kinase [Cochleicola gelatinilyticus]OAB79663.1 anhydro-N-acetylmuramic acid kinase [Cochleicola gelatinilyticus]